uniref:Uncharacterized protein n=1 Tax=Anguilla anguilla TaxID=7936 RepID=A0A0E9XUT8_ANGAN
MLVLSMIIGCTPFCMASSATEQVKMRRGKVLTSA